MCNIVPLRPGRLAAHMVAACLLAAPLSGHAQGAQPAQTDPDFTRRLETHSDALQVRVQKLERRVAALGWDPTPQTKEDGFLGRRVQTDTVPDELDRIKVRLGALGRMIESERRQASSERRIAQLEHDLALLEREVVRIEANSR
jgi:hypothetical protein